MAKLSETEYRKWARNLVGKDWEIFWQEDEDRDEDRNEDDAIAIEILEGKTSATSATTTTASGQETAEEQKATITASGTIQIEMQIEGVNEEIRDSSGAKVGSSKNDQAIEKPNGSKELEEDGGKNEDNVGTTSSSDEGSIIDDWYDGNVLGIIDDDAGPVGENGWKFKVLFLGEEDIYEVFLEPGKVRPSARGWVQRSIALLNPPITAAGENNNNKEVDSSLPPDTSTLDDQTHLQGLRSKVIDSSNQLDGFIPLDGIEKSDPEVPSLPSYNNFRRVQILRFQLESQIFLRGKLSKIENHSGKELFTDGVRNPTENYVNYLVQSCKDLAQACSWYCDSWRLLLYYFGSTPNNLIENSSVRSERNNHADENEEEERRQPTHLSSLTFEGLIKEYIEFGKDTIVNAAMIDVNISGPSNKRRQAIVSDLTSSNNRRTKRRRKTTSTMGGSEEENNEKIAKLLAAASKLDTEILSKHYVDIFVKTVKDNNYFQHIAILGNMLKSLSHLVVDPLILWKNQARCILGTKNNGNDSYNMSIDKIDAKVMNETKSMPSDGEEEEAEVFFSDKQIEACLSSIRSNNVLSRFNLFDEIHKLHAKLGDIQQNETKILALLNDLASITTSSQKESYNQSEDKVVSGLTTILNEMNSPESTLYNVDPLSTKKASCVVTRDHLAKAIELRSWFVDVQHVQLVRERHSFLQRLLSKIEPTNTLPNPKDIPALANNSEVFQQRQTLIQRVLEIRSKINKSAGIIEKRENDFLVASSSADFSKSSDLTSHLEFLLSILSEMKELPVIFPIEEKIAVGIDLIRWYQKAYNMLGPDSEEGMSSLPFVELEILYENLQSVLRGSSSSRSALINGIMPDIKTNDELCKVLSSDLFSDCQHTIKRVTTLYNSSSSWKKRAETIILCLRTHGNETAGEAIISQKLPAMVDIKRITDLTIEYPGLCIDIPGFIEKLERIQSESFQWSQNLYNTITNEHGSFTDALSFIQIERDRRPKGIIIYPTRAVADSTVDFLAWYEKIKHTAKIVAEEVQQSSVANDPHELAALYSKFMVERLYPILADGSEALEIYFTTHKKSNEMPVKFNLTSKECVEILGKEFRIRKTSRALSREKICSNDLISSLFRRMGSKDEKEGFPLQLMVWIQWHLLVADFVSQRENDEKFGLDRSTKVRSLLQAKQMEKLNPFLSDDLDFSNARYAKTLIQTKTKELIEFERLIEEAQDAEASIKKSLATSRELFRGSLLEKAERIRQHLITLRTMATMLKARSLGGEGLSINVSFENPLERHIKCFTWLVRILQYPVLHQGEAAFTSSTEGNDIELTRIPFNALVSIHERMPSEISEFGDHILCILRVRELYAAAKNWQDEVSRTTLISNRGNKRRGATSENTTQAESKEAEKDAKLCMRKMEMLAEDHILSKVDMPRQKAVQAMVESKKQFEIQLESFLAQDFNGNQDNAPLPNGDSLVGRNGQFILYRLTGSSLFSMMQTSVQSLATIGDNVFAETRGKAAFDWMKSAVTWIEELEDAVEAQSKLTDAKQKLLVIPLKDAKRLCKLGETNFLETTNRDVTQTLSKHGIYVSVNSIKKRLNVRLKKDGAHHSVGGIIIRWCPILFDALRADVAKLESWESKLEKAVGNFNAFVAQSSSAIASEDNLYKWYCYHMEIQTALEEGQNALVVSPTKERIDSFAMILRTIRKHLDENCSRNMIQEFSKRRFSNSASIYTGRFDLLDALLYRREITDDNKMEDAPIAAHERERSLRDVCRSNLENALLRAVWVLNLESQGVLDVEDLCAIKSWEIELAMFETFQDENAYVYGLSRGYEAKARNLKSILENPANLSLCLEVLLDDIKSSTLVKMTAEQLASRLKVERDKANRVALKEKSPLKELSSGSSHVSQSKALKSILKNKARYSTIQKDIPKIRDVMTDEMLNDGHNEVCTEYDSDLNADGAPTMDSDEEESDKKQSPSEAQSQLSSSLVSKIPKVAGAKRKNWGHETPRSPPPPPPPSLASSFDTSLKDSRSSSIGLEPRITSASGGEFFKMELHGQTKYTFSAMFYQEDTFQSAVGRFMPELLVQRGRSKIDDFDKFLSEKLKGGRWQATSLRMATASDRDASVYKAFYKDFEAKERIAMFKLRDEDSAGGKLFLVTPRFHHVARRTRGIAFGKKNSTYAVVLTKKDDDEIRIN